MTPEEITEIERQREQEAVAQMLGAMRRISAGDARARRLALKWGGAARFIRAVEAHWSGRLYGLPSVGFPRPVEAL